MGLETIQREKMIIQWNAYVLDNLDKFDKSSRDAIIKNYDEQAILFHQQDYRYDFEDDYTLNKLRNGDHYIQYDSHYDPDLPDKLPYTLKMVNGDNIISTMKSLDSDFVQYCIENKLDKMNNEELFLFYEERCVADALNNVSHLHPISCQFVASNIENDVATGMVLLGLPVRLEGVSFSEERCDEAIYYIGLSGSANVLEITDGNELIVEPSTMALTEDPILHYATRQFQYLNDNGNGNYVFSSFKIKQHVSQHVPEWDYMTHTTHDLIVEGNHKLMQQLQNIATQYIQSGQHIAYLENNKTWYVLDDDRVFTQQRPQSLSDLFQQQKEMIQEIKTQNRPSGLKIGG